MKVTVMNHGGYDSGVYRVCATIHAYTNKGQWYSYHAGPLSIEEAKQIVVADFKNEMPLDERNWTPF